MANHREIMEVPWSKIFCMICNSKIYVCLFTGRRTFPRSFMPQENLFQLVPSSRTRSYNGESTLLYSGDLHSIGWSDSQRNAPKCKTSYTHAQADIIVMSIHSLLPPNPMKSHIFIYPTVPLSTPVHIA